MRVGIAGRVGLGVIGVALVASAVAAPARAAVVGFDLLAGSTSVGSGSMSFDDALQGTTVSWPQLSGFTLTTNGQTFNLGLPATGAVPNPLFPEYELRYNSATQQFLTDQVAPSFASVMRGAGAVGDSTATYAVESFYNYQAGPPTLSGYGVLTGSSLAGDQFTNFDRIAVTSDGSPSPSPSAVPEPSSMLLALGAVGMVAAGRGWRRRAATRG